MQSNQKCIVVLGTGGTIAGKSTGCPTGRVGSTAAETAADAGSAGIAVEPADDLGYTAAQIGVARLVAELPVAVGVALVETEQVAQIDSKDMSWEVWRSLAEVVARQLSRSEVAGVVITHGTDTLEETAWFLQRVLAPERPVVLAAAMRPATSWRADGPQNLADALQVARHRGARGVVMTMAGKVHSALDVRKIHTQRPDAFSSGEAGPIAAFVEHVDGAVAQPGRSAVKIDRSMADGASVVARSLRRHRPWPSGEALGLACLPADSSAWPWVEIVHSHAGANGAAVRALCAAGVQGIVVAATGNGTLHEVLAEALQEAVRAGIPVWRSTRCLDGGVVDAEPLSDMAGAMPSAGAMTPAQARIEMMLRLLRFGDVGGH